MPELFSFTENVDLTGYKVIIPTISVGNVPQLIADLLITMYKMKKVGTVWHPGIIPCVSADPYEFPPTGVSTACELYLNKDLKLAVIQLRSTIDPRAGVNFFRDLKDSLTKFNPEITVIISSGFDFEMRDVLQEKSYYLSNCLTEKLDALNVQKLRKDVTDRYYLSNGGFAVELYQTLSSNLKCVLLGKYVSEGDNRPDAVYVLEKLLKLIDVNMVEVVFPYSWKYVFGGPPPVGMF